MTSRTAAGAVSFQPPPGYAGIPLAEDIDDRGAAIRQVIAAGMLTLPDVEPTVRAGLVLAVTALDGNGPEPSSTARRVLSEGLAERLRRDKPAADVGVVDVPAGPAAAVIETGEYRLPPADPQAEPLVVPLCRAQVFLPAPDCRRLVVLDCSTGSVEHEERFAALAVDVLRSIRFTSTSRAAYAEALGS